MLRVSDLALATGRFLFPHGLKRSPLPAYTYLDCFFIMFIRRLFETRGKNLRQEFPARRPARLFAARGKLLKGAIMKPQISVLIPVLNAEKYLPLCLSCLAKQTFADFEIICIDSASTDGSLAVLAQAAKEDPRLHYVTQPNKGIAAARNELVKKAQGKYLAFVDADDFIFPAYLEKLYHAAETEQAEIGKCFFHEVEENGFPRLQEHCHSSFYRLCAEGDGARFRGGYEDSVLWGKLFLREWFVNHQFEFWTGRVAEDFCVVILAYLYAKKIAVVPEKLYCYRKGHSAAITANSYNMAVGALLNLADLKTDLIRRQKWNRQTAQEWMRATVWGICRFRKFSAEKRLEQQELLLRAFKSARESVGQCGGISYLRWHIFFVLVKICGRKSVYFWSKIFR